MHMKRNLSLQPFYIPLLILSFLFPFSGYAQTTGNMLTFDNSNEYVSIPSTKSLEITGDFTIEAWVKIVPPRYPSSQIGCFVQKGPNWVDKKYLDMYNLGVDNVYGRLVLTIGDGISQMDQAYGKTNIFSDTWVHVAGVRSQGTLAVYVNGKLDNTPIKRTISQYINQEKMIIGSSSINTSHVTIGGSMDEIRIWNYARASYQIAQTFGCMVNPKKEPGLVAYYKFDESASTQTVNDSSSNGNHGYLGSDPYGVDIRDPERGISTLNSSNSLNVGPDTREYGNNAGGNNTLDLKWNPGSLYDVGQVVASRAWPASPGILGISLAPGYYTGGGLTVLINLSTGLFLPPYPINFDQSGRYALPTISLRVPELSGCSFYLQALESRSGIPYLSNGLEIKFSQ